MLVQRALVVFALLGFCPTALGQTAVPARQQGVALRGSRASAVSVEIFCDLLCPDCKASWPTFYGLVETGLFTDAELGVTLNGLALPYHYGSNPVLTAFYAFLAQPSVTHDRVNECLNNIFSSQDELTTAAAQNLGETKFRELLVTFFGKNCNVDLKEVNNNQTLYSYFRGQAISDFKYSVIRGMGNTPSVIVNGIPAPRFSMFLLNDWESAVRDLLRGEDQPSV